MSAGWFSRREFLVIGGSVAVGALAGTHLRTSRAFAASSPSRVIHRLSLRGRRGSKAAKRHNANMRFATQSAANLHRAHPGDHSRIVPLVVSEATFHRLFPNPDSVVADLRKAAHACTGDCNGNGTVTVDELVKGVNIALGTATPDACPSFDSNKDGKVTVDELVKAVNRALTGCAS